MLIVLTRLQTLIISMVFDDFLMVWLIYNILAPSQTPHRNSKLWWPQMLRVASFETWDSHLSNDATLISRGVHQLEIQSGFSKAVDLGGSWQEKMSPGIPM